MKVRLIQNVLEQGRIKASIRKNGEKVVAFTAGAVIEMSETSAKKYVDKGLAVYLDEDEENERKQPNRKSDSVTDSDGDRPKANRAVAKRRGK